MSDYKPGTVAKATVRGVADVTVMRSGTGNVGEFWWSATYVNHARLHLNDDVTDVRPLVVLDLNESVGKGHLPIWLRNNAQTLEKGVVSPSSFFKDMNWLADQIEEQTRPAIEEPGLWGVVEASTKEDGRREWVRHVGIWLADGAPLRQAEWDDLIDPVLIREGVQS